VAGDVNAGTRVERFAHASDLSAVAQVLSGHRQEVLDRWLAAAAAQSFHLGSPEHAVADHIPRLYDALTAVLERAAPRSVDPEAPLEDAAVLAAAQEHARARVAQGLTAADVLTEFRLLRQEIGRVLRRYLSDFSASTDVVGAELLVHDALDGAVFVSLSTLSQHEEERRSLYEAEQRARAEAEQAVRIRDQVLAAVSHDHKTPLTAIRGYAQLLERQLRRQADRLAAPAAAAMTESLTQIQASIRKMVRWIDELNDVTRLQSGQSLPLDRHPVDLVALAEQVVAEHRREARSHRLQVCAETPAVVGQWDQVRLERVLHNLIGNAIKYSPNGGAVDVTITREAPDADTGGTGGASRAGDHPDDPDNCGKPGDPGSAGARWAVVRVSDQGLGVPAADLPHLFEPFYRGTNVAGTIEGTGIGLPVARRVVVEHGGTIEVESEEGVGSTFTIRLPLAPPALPPTPAVGA
jgi:signal transduction histidine kinase